MDRYVLDVNVVLDYYDELRMVKYPDSVRVFEYIRDRGTGFISSSSLDNIAFLKTRDLMVDKNLTFNDAKKVCKYMLKEILSFFKIAKTPSYLALDYENIEDSQLIASAKAIGAKIVTRDSKLIEDFPEMTIHPKDFFGYLEGKKIHISMLDITKQTFNIYEKIEENMDKVIVKSNFILGEEVKILENKIANYIGTKHAVAVSSGTDALLISLRALAIKRKNKEYWDREDLIITTPFTFTATGDTILRSGATPLFVDIDLQTYNIDPVQIREAFKKYGKKVVGIVPVHLYGLPCDMDEIKELSDENDIFIVEDCAQAFGSKYKGKKVGSFGDTGCFSFFPSKNLGAFGDAGAITTDDDELVEIIRMLRVHGGKDKYNVEHIGYKARMDTIQAAVLLAKLNYIDELNERRIFICQKYIDELRNLDWLILPYIPSSDCYHTFHQFTVFVKNGNREKIQKFLKEKNIQTMVYYSVPLHKMKAFKNRFKIYSNLSNSEIASNSVFSLPVEPLMDKEQLSYIIKIINSFNLE